jgi:hypothetical protein
MERNWERPDQGWSAFALYPQEQLTIALLKVQAAADCGS